MRADETGIGPVGFGGDHLDLHALSLLAAPRSKRLGAARGSSPSADREPLVAEEEVDEARPGDLGALDHLEPGGRLRDLGRDLPRRPPPRPGELQRDVRRVVAVLSLSRPLELELGSGRDGERGRQLPDGISRQRSRAAAKRSSSARISSGEPTPISTSPTSIGVSGSGVVSKLPSAFRKAITIAPVSWRMRSSRIVRPAAAHVSAHLDLRELEVGSGRRRHGVEEGGDLWLEHEVRHHLARGRVREHDPVRAGEGELLLRVGPGGARDDRQVGMRRAGREDDVEVVGVVVGGGHEPLRALEARLAQVLVVRRVSLDEERPRRSFAAATASSWKSTTTKGTSDARNSSPTRRPTRP